MTRRLLWVCLTAAALLIASPFASFAHASSSALALSPLGVEVPISGEDGAEVARITVSGLEEPFLAYEPNRSPIRGYHFISLTMSVENTGSAPFAFDPRDLLLRDVEGFLYLSGGLNRLDQSAGADLERQDIVPGASVEGVVGFQVLTGPPISHVLYTPRSGLLIPLVDFGTEPPAFFGDSIPVVASDSSWIGHVSVDEALDPFEDFHDNSPPAAGTRYVLISVTLLNDGFRPLDARANDFLLQDTDGNVYSSTHVRQAPDAERPELKSQELSVDDEASGVIGFVVPEDARLVHVLYQPAADRLVNLADLAEIDSLPEATPVPGQLNCDDIGPWLQEAINQTSAAYKLIPYLLGLQIQQDPTYAENAHLVADAMVEVADFFADAAVPASVLELNQQMVDAFYAYAAALADVAHATETGDPAALQSASQALYDAEPALIDMLDQVQALADVCGVEPQG